MYLSASMLLLPSHVRPLNRSNVAGFTEHTDAVDHGGRGSDLADQDAALSVAFDGDGNERAGCDEFARPTAAEVLEEVARAETTVVACADARVTCQQPAHPDFVTRARGVEEPADQPL